MYLSELTYIPAFPGAHHVAKAMYLSELTYISTYMVPERPRCKSAQLGTWLWQQYLTELNYISAFPGVHHVAKAMYLTELTYISAILLYTTQEKIPDAILFCTALRKLNMPSCSARTQILQVPSCPA
jgi:hypothetical protein